MLLAGVCLAHCLLAPVLAAIWPVVGVPLARAAGLHQLFAFITLVLSPLILVPGYLVHRRKVIASLGGSGAVLLLLGATQAGAEGCSVILAAVEGLVSPSEITWREWVGFLATPVGCLMVVAAHLWNRNLLAKRAHRCRGGRPC